MSAASIFNKDDKIFKLQNVHVEFKPTRRVPDLYINDKFYDSFSRFFIPFNQPSDLDLDFPSDFTYYFFDAQGLPLDWATLQTKYNGNFSQGLTAPPTALYEGITAANNSTTDISSIHSLFYVNS